MRADAMAREAAHFERARALISSHRSFWNQGVDAPAFPVVLDPRGDRRDTTPVAQEPKSQTKQSSASKAGGQPASGQAEGRRAPRDGKNKRGSGKGGRRPGGRERGSSNSPLTTGLFSGLADKELPCKIKGCKKTFLWTGQEQLRSFGKPPPQRMCEGCVAEFHKLEDTELPCRNAPECKESWVWKRGAQMHALQRMRGDGPLKAPSRLCASCFDKEKLLKDQEVECRTQGCSRTWTWARDAQVRHRAWLRREKAKLAKTEDTPPEAADQTSPEAGEALAQASSTEAPSAPVQAGADGQPISAEGQSAKAPSNKKKRRKKPRRLQEGPPERHCKACADRFARLVPVELPCKVHGCQSSWTWDRVSQLKAWAALGTDDIEAPIKLIKRMCNRCRDFCKKNNERAVVCAKEGCEDTWTFKVGAQLQHALATGGVEDPSRLCERCVQEQYNKKKGQKGELMPCAMSGCSGTWLYTPGMELMADDGSEIPQDRLCNACRSDLGLPERPEGPAPENAQAPVEENAGEQGENGVASGEVSPKASSVENPVEIGAQEAVSDGATSEGAVSESPETSSE